MKKISLLAFLVLFFGSGYFLPTRALADTTTCSNVSVPDAPNLFQITRTTTNPQTAQLYFSPIPSSDQFTGYTIIYGFQANDNRYSLSIPYGTSTGVIKIAINNLDPKLAYTFKVRADNGCANGPWSNYRSDGFPIPLATSGATKGGLLVAGNWEMPTILTSVFTILTLSGLFLFL